MTPSPIALTLAGAFVCAAYIAGSFARQLARLSPRLRRFHLLTFLAVYLALVVVVTTARGQSP